MRVLISLITAILFVSVFAVVSYAIDNASPALSASPSYAVLTKKTGEVKVLPVGSTTWHDAELDQKYATGYVIRTGSESAAQLALSDGSIIKLSRFTQITIDPVEREVSFSIGKIFVNFIKGGKPPQVKTPTSVAAAMGTIWVQEIFSDGATEIHLIDGQVNFTSGGATQALNAGQLTSALANQPPLAPQAFNVAEYVKLEAILKDMDVKQLIQSRVAETPVVPEDKAITDKEKEKPNEDKPKEEQSKDNKPKSIRSGVDSGGYLWSFTAAGDGLHGVSANPANLAENNLIDVMIPQFGIFTSNNAITGTQFLNLVTNGGPQARTDIENAVAAAGSLSGKLQNRIATGFSVANFALTFSNNGLWDVNSISPDAVTILLGDAQKLNPVLGTARTWNVSGQITINQPTSANLSYAQPLTLFSIPLSIGATAKLYSGGAYAYNSLNYQAFYNGAATYTETANVFIQDKATSASGMGFDIGAKTKLGDNLLLAAVITDIGSDITWQGSHGVGSASVTLPGAGAGNFTTTYTTTNATFATAQNTTMKVGAAYTIDLLGPTMLAADYIAPKFTNSGINLGAEKVIGPVVLRIGSLTDIYTTSSIMTYGIGLKLGPLSLDLTAAGNGLNDKKGAFAFNALIGF